MNKTRTLGSYCYQRIAPVAIALTIAAFSSDAFASPGQDAINAKLKPAFIPSLKVATSVSKAKPADLLLALAFALEDPANSALSADEIAAGALELDTLSGKFRSDKDKIAGQIVATTAATRTLSAANLSQVLRRVYSSSAGLKPAGKAQAVIAALKAAGNATDGNNLGATLAPVAGTNADISLLLQNTSKGLAAGTYAASGQLTNFVDGLFDGNAVATAERAGVVKDAADKIAAANATAAGAFYGGLVLNNPSGAYTGNAALETFAAGILADAKLAKAIGEILGNTLGAHTSKKDIDNVLVTGSTSAAVKPLIYQGILRAGTTADVPLVLDAGVLGGVTDKAAFAGSVATGNGNDSAKLGAIVQAIAGGADAATKTKIGISVISAVALNTPAAAGTATGALFDSAGGGFASDADRLAFGLAAAPKIKTFAAVGALAKEIANYNTASTSAALAGVATSIMGKAPKAATDIAQQVSSLSNKISNYTQFTKDIADSNKKFVLNAAVGVSITSPENAGKITAAAITHSPVADKGALSQAAKISSAVALAVDEERAADIALEVGNLLSDPKSTSAATKPINLSSAAAIATALAKAIQAKPNVSTANRMDELGEVAANLTANILGKSQGKDAAAILKAETKLVSAVGTAILKALSPKPTLNGEYPVNNVSDTTLRLFASKATLKADQTEAQDIIGSIAQTITSFYATNTVTANALIGPGSAIEKAFLKLAGKPGSNDYIAAVDALTKVRAGATGNAAAIFEDGTKVSTNGSINDKETDTRNL